MHTRGRTAHSDDRDYTSLPVHSCTVFGQLLRAAPAAEATKGGEPLVYIVTPGTRLPAVRNRLAHCSAAPCGAGNAVRACESTNHALEPSRFEGIAGYTSHMAERTSLLVTPAGLLPCGTHGFNDHLLPGTEPVVAAGALFGCVGVMPVPAVPAVQGRLQLRLPLGGSMVDAGISQRPGLGTPAARSSGSGPSGVGHRRHAAAWHMDTVWSVQGMYCISCTHTGASDCSACAEPGECQPEQ